MPSKQSRSWSVLMGSGIQAGSLFSLFMLPLQVNSYCRQQSVFIYAFIRQMFAISPAYRNTALVRRSRTPFSQAVALPPSEPHSCCLQKVDSSRKTLLLRIPAFDCSMADGGSRGRRPRRSPPRCRRLREGPRLWQPIYVIYVLFCKCSRVVALGMPVHRLVVMETDASDS